MRQHLLNPRGSLFASLSRPSCSCAVVRTPPRSLSQREPRASFQLTRPLLHFHRSIHNSTKVNAQTSQVKDYLLADVGEGITECEIIKWFVEPGSTVEEFDVLVEVQSDKASVEITSRYGGVVKEHCYKVGEVAKVGSALCRIEVQSTEETAGIEEETSPKSQEEDIKDTTSAEASEARMSGRGEASVSHSSTGQGKSVLATPAVRRVVREHGVEIGKVTGTGKSGRVTKEDVRAYVTSMSSSSSETGSTPSSQAVSAKEGETVVKSLTGTRKAMFKAMTAAWTIPHFGYSDEIDITKLDQIRKDMQTSLAKTRMDGLKLTLLPFLLKALSLAMYRHPIFRSTLDESTMSLHEKDHHRISIALSSSRGLLTPTLPNDVRQSNVLDIAEQVQSLQRTSIERVLNQKEMGSGATLTLSNIGNIGGLTTFPIIPPTGQLIIGAVGRSRILPRFDEKGDIVKALILPASFSADHRVVEGVELSRFVQEWKELVENPASWLLRLR